MSEYIDSWATYNQPEIYGYSAGPQQLRVEEPQFQQLPSIDLDSLVPYGGGAETPVWETYGLTQTEWEDPWGWTSGAQQLQYPQSFFSGEESSGPPRGTGFSISPSGGSSWTTAEDLQSMGINPLQRPGLPEFPELSAPDYGEFNLPERDEARLRALIDQQAAPALWELRRSMNKATLGLRNIENEYERNRATQNLFESAGQARANILKSAADAGRGIYEHEYGDVKEEARTNYQTDIRQESDRVSTLNQRLLGEYSGLMGQYDNEYREYLDQPLSWRMASQDSRFQTTNPRVISSY